MLHANPAISTTRPIASFQEQYEDLMKHLSIVNDVANPVRHYHEALNRCDYMYGYYGVTHNDVLKRLYFQIYFELAEVLFSEDQTENGFIALKSAIDYRKDLTSKADKLEEIAARHKLINLLKKADHDKEEIFSEQENLIKALEFTHHLYGACELHLKNAYTNLALDYLQQQEAVLALGRDADVTRLQRAFELLRSAGTEQANMFLALFLTSEDEVLLAYILMDTKDLSETAQKLLKDFSFTKVKVFALEKQILFTDRTEALRLAGDISPDFYASLLRSTILDLQKCVSESNVELFLQYLDDENYPLVETEGDENISLYQFICQSSSLEKEAFIKAILSRGYPLTNVSAEHLSLATAENCEAAVIAEHLPLAMTGLVAEYMAIKPFVGNSNLFWSANSKNNNPQKRKLEQEEVAANKMPTLAEDENTSVLNSEEQLTQELPSSPSM